MQQDQHIASILRIIVNTGIYVAMAGILTAAPPKQLTAAEMDELNRLSTQVGRQVAQRRLEVQKTIDASNRVSTKTDTEIRSFLQRIGQSNLIAQNNVSTPSVPSVNSGVPPTAPSSTKDKGSTIKVKCDGGFYFDSEGGLLVFLKNIRLEESGSNFKLRCSDELKVFLASSPQKENTSEPDKKKKDKSFDELGDLRQIIAIGKVKISGTTGENEPFLASGDIASYDATDGQMILKGGMPTLQQSANQFLQAKEPGQWITIQMKNKKIQSIIASEGKWEMQATTKKKTR